MPHGWLSPQAGRGLQDRGHAVGTPRRTSLCQLQCHPCPLSLGTRLGDGSRECFFPAIPQQLCSSPSASPALFWAPATGCSGPSPGSAWTRALPTESILGTAIIVGFTYFLLSVASLMLRGFVSPKGSSCSPFPLESKGRIIWPSLCAAALKCALTSPVLKLTCAPQGPDSVFRQSCLLSATPV